MKVTIVSHNNFGEIVFLVDGKRCKYSMDPMHFNGGFFQSWMRNNPIKALDFAKQRGKIIDLNKPSISMGNLSEFYHSCPECGIHPDSYQNGVIPCPNCGHSSSNQIDH